ncbi:MAG TPA: FAD-binding oxidoreductase [Bryobacteraceae bacterium]|nr:FAD-binding oxidoreductase [Bryobacteraceae bacterium]
MLRPSSPEELASALADAAGRKQTIALFGNNSKRLMAGPVMPADVEISTAGLDRLLQYEPRDLTISVEAGMRYVALRELLANNNQMIPLDPPFAEECTIGGVVAANCSGPRRRLYGTARDMVIGMKFATLEGRLIDTGGMVVKNVAGLDMGKVMIGSFGTLAAIAVVNFKLSPIPPVSRTFAREFADLESAMAARDSVLKSVLQPASLDLLKTERGYRLVMQVGGNQAVVDRYTREFAGAEVFEGESEDRLWSEIREFVPAFLRANADGAVVRVRCALSEVGAVMAAMSGPALARAGSGVCYGLVRAGETACSTLPHCSKVVEFGPQEMRESAELWPEPGSDFAMMKKVKEMFDPQSLLNRRRLYGRI